MRLPRHAVPGANIHAARGRDGFKITEFQWRDFNVADADDEALSIVIAALPQDGLLQYHNGVTWTPVSVGQTISRSAIEAGLFCFGPDANESGVDAHGVTGMGNLRQDYAQFTYHATDGLLSSASVTFTLDVTPVADAPSMSLTAPRRHHR